jgi:integrase
MASISKTTAGNYRVQFFDAENQRQSVLVGKVTKHAARSVALKIEALLDAKITGQPMDRETAQWIGKLGSVMYERLAEVDLLPRREAATLGPFLTTYLATRTDVKSGTATFYGHTQRNLIDHFGADKPLRDVTPGDADEFRLWLLRPWKENGTGGQGLSEATARRRCTMASQFFHAAVRKGLIAVNPFEGIGGKVKSNKARVYFVTRDEAEKVLAACPDSEWRLIFALSRFGGLRTPSEHYGLRWTDVDWERGKFLVHSPKTEHHEGGESRWVPIFPELRPYLEAVFHEPGGADFVINRYRNQANLRTRFEKIIKRAGLKPWPKLFHNLRASRQTELAAEHPLHVVCAWIGNKAAIAAEHYLQVTEADYERAANSVCTTCAVGHENSEMKGNDGNGPESEMPGIPDDSSLFNIMHPCGMGDEGFEPPTSTV